LHAHRVTGYEIAVFKKVGTDWVKDQALGGTRTAANRTFTTAALPATGGEYKFHLIASDTRSGSQPHSWSGEAAFSITDDTPPPPRSTGGRRRACRSRRWR
jgi:hypothetical protein